MGIGPDNSVGDLNISSLFAAETVNMKDLAKADMKVSCIETGLAGRVEITPTADARTLVPLPEADET